jgi:hypothetical protein
MAGRYNITLRESTDRPAKPLPASISAAGRLKRLSRNGCTNHLYDHVSIAGAVEIDVNDPQDEYGNECGSDGFHELLTTRIRHEFPAATPAEGNKAPKGETPYRNISSLGKPAVNIALPYGFPIAIAMAAAKKGNGIETAARNQTKRAGMNGISQRIMRWKANSAQAMT